MTASKLSRIQGRIAAAEAERAVLARAKALAAAAPAPKAAPTPKATTTVQAIPPHIQALIAHAEAKASAPAMSPAVKAAPVAPVATSKAGEDWRSERLAALSSVPQWKPGERFPADGRVDNARGGRYVVLSRDASGAVGDYGYLPD